MRPTSCFMVFAGCMKMMYYNQKCRDFIRRVLIGFLLGIALMMVSGTVYAQTDTGGSEQRMFVPEAWPRETGAAVNSSPVLGDLDQDGVLEIVVGADNNKVYAWKPDGTLMPGWPVTTGDSVRSSPALADIDNDGRLDVIVGSFDNKVYVWNFNGSLLAGWPVVTGSVVYSSPAVGDIDGDQRPEVIAGSFDNKVYAWNADGTLVRGWPKATGLFVYSSPALADLDNDGTVEVIVGTDNNRVFAWNGDGTDVDGWPTATEHVVPSSPAVGDIDNDGILEVVVGSWDKVFVWNSRGERKAGWPVTAGHQIPSSPALADLDRDGRLDIIVGCKDGRVYAWDANGQPLRGWPAITDAEISASPAVGDLNGDGVLEVVIGSKDNKVYVWDAEGRLLPGWPKNTGGAISSSPAIGDVDGDGSFELVIGSKDTNVYAWSFPRTGTVAPRVVWGNFHGDISHSGQYQLLPQAQQPEQIRTASTQQRPAIQPMQPSELPQTVPATSSGVVVPREIREGYISDLMISDYDDIQVTLTWTAPSGIRTPQTTYEIRYSTEAITEETWAQAISYPTVLIPASAGAREVSQLSNLPRADVFYLAVKLRDNQIVYPLSNVVRLERMDTTPPAAIQGLKVADLSDEVLELSWIATGDDGVEGLITTYDIRYSEAPLNELTWLRAIQVGDEPAPLPADVEQKFQLRKPWNDREIYFGIKAIDEALNISELSEVVVWTPKDDIPPSRIVDLRVTAVNADDTTLTWTAPGNDQTSGKALRYEIRYSEYPLTDQNWASAVLVENPPSPEVSGTPQTYTLQGMTPGLVGYIGVKAFDNSGNASPLSNVVEPAMADFTPPAPIDDLTVAEVGKDWVRLSWTATGDDERSGSAALYVLRYGGNLRIVKDWVNAQDVLEVPIPSIAGAPEVATMSGLEGNTTYYIALRALDKQGNMSELSNILRVKTFGRSTPEAVTDLVIEEFSVKGLTLNWTAPQDLGEDTATVTGYDVRFARTEISEATWDTATKIPAPRKPAAPGTLETFTLKGMPDDSSYYVAIKSYDALGNPSGLSNVLFVPQLDAVEPEAIFDLFVEEAGPDWVRLSWTATGDDKQQGQATSYQIRTAPTLSALKDWEQATDIPVDVTPAASGMTESFTVTGLGSKTTMYVAIKAMDEFGNMADLSNIIRVQTKDAEAPSVITDLRIADLQEDALVLEWTAPGEDGMQGQATAYDVRYSNYPVTDDSWEMAEVVPLVPKPSPAGTTERLTVKNLNPDTLYYFAAVATDSSGNRSPISNVADVLTIDTVPPPVITTLRVADVENGVVRLTWLSPGDDAYRDMPERYEIRYRKGKDSVLDEDSWAKAALVKEPPIPSGRGMEEEFSFSGLDRNAWYSIGIKAIDEYGNTPVISNVVRVHTSSAWVDDLVILDFSGQSVTLTWTAPGGDVSEGERQYAIRYATVPITEANWGDAIPAKTLLPQDLIVEEPGSKEKVELTDLPPYEQVFFAARVSRQTPERRLSGLSNVVELNRIDIIPPGEVVNLQVADLGDGADNTRTLELSWIAPGDNELEGTATKYEVRYGTVPPTEESWDSLIPVTDIPQPVEAGTVQKAVVRIPAGEDTLYFAIKAFDEALNVSGLSNMAEWAPEDFTAPAAVADLRVERVNGGNITISWTAPGDNENRGIASIYDIRYATRESDIKKWDRAMVVSGEPFPEVAGTRQEYTITGLQQDTMYYVALKTTDDAKNTSAPSNILAVRSADGIPPAAIGDLRIERTGDDWAELLWTASGDDGNSGRADAYSLRYATDPEELKQWENAYEVVDIQTPKNPGKEERVRVKDLRSNTTYYFAVRVIDNGGNAGALSNMVQTMTTDGESSAPIQDLAFAGSSEATVTLSWTAPRDRGPVDRIARYDVRYDEDRERLLQWSRAEQEKKALVPGEPGSLESIVIEGLAPNRLYYVGIKAIDQKGNISDVSNIVEAYTADTIAPQPVADLSVQSATENTINVSWTVVADDQLRDMPTIYELRYHLEPIDAANWEMADPVRFADPAVFTPTTPGAFMQFTITQLLENTNYYFAIRARDAAGNLSPVSNVVAARTSDVTPPQSVADLQTIFPTGNSIMLTWASPSDIQTSPSVSGVGQSGIPGIDLAVDRYDIRYTVVEPENGVLDGKEWDAAEQVLVSPPPQAPGLTEKFVVHNLVPGMTYYFAMQAIDKSGNRSDLSNTVIEATLPFEPTPIGPTSLGTRSMADYAWELQQGQQFGELTKDQSGVFMLTPKVKSRAVTSAPTLTAVYPQTSQMMEVRQSKLHVEVKTPQRFAMYVQVRAVTGEEYYLCYTTDFGMAVGLPETDTSEIQDAEPRRRTIVEQRRKERIENYIFFPIEPEVLDNVWHALVVDLTRDLYEGAGTLYDATTRVAVRSSEMAFRGMSMQGPVYTKIEDFQGLQHPFEKGWKIHYGSGIIDIAREAGTNVPEGGESAISSIGLVPMAGQENMFLKAKADSHQGMVVTYPKDGISQLSAKPYFLANVRAVGDFKVILKVSTKDNREYYVAYLPESQLQQIGLSGNYIYQPLPVVVDEQSAGRWMMIQANIAEDLQRYQLDYAYTSWMSFHGSEFSLDNLRFSTEILETVIE